MRRGVTRGAVLACAFVLCCALRPSAQQDVDVDELLRRVDVESDDLNLDALLRQAGVEQQAGAPADDAASAHEAPSRGRSRPLADDAAGAHGVPASLRPRTGGAPTAAGAAGVSGAGRGARPLGGNGAGGRREQPDAPASEAAPIGRSAQQREAPAPPAESGDFDLSQFERYEQEGEPSFGGFGFASSDGDDEQMAQAEPEYEEEEAEETSSGAGSFALRIDKRTLTVLRRWANFANGVLLLLLGPVTLAISAGSLALDKMVLSLYISLFGLIFAAQELRVEPVVSWLRLNFQFLATHGGRAAFLLFSGNLLWTFGRVGVVPAVLTCANSVFNAKFQSILNRFD